MDKSIIVLESELREMYSLLSKESLIDLLIKKYSVSNKSLVYGGEIANLPIEIVERMLIEQVAQGNPKDISVFEKDSGANKYSGGFNWYHVKEDGKMWDDVLRCNDFNGFYKKYPKTK
jgi:hypothetical protein